MHVNEEANHIQPLVSVVVPVYQAESYLSRCLDSILTQTFTDFEVILVDDGSKDNSGEICDEYAAKDNRFRVIHQENHGVSVARQVGLDAAIGDYVIHADPDDRVEPDWLSCLYDEAIASGADMIICDYEKVLQDKRIYCSQKPSALTSDGVLQDMLYFRTWGVCWNKLIRRACFQKYDVKFHPDMNIWEDLYVTSSLLLHDMKISYVPRALYHYDMYSNPDSAVRYNSVSKIRSRMFFIDTFSSILSGKQYEDAWYIRKVNIKRSIYRLRANNTISIVDTYREVNSRFVKEHPIRRPFGEDVFLAISLRGYPRLAVISQNLVNWMRRMKKAVKIN